MASWRGRAVCSLGDGCDLPAISENAAPLAATPARWEPGKCHRRGHPEIDRDRDQPEGMSAPVPARVPRPWGLLAGDAERPSPCPMMGTDVDATCGVVTPAVWMGMSGSSGCSSVQFSISPSSCAEAELSIGLCVPGWTQIAGRTDAEHAKTNVTAPNIEGERLPGLGSEHIQNRQDMLFEIVTLLVDEVQPRCQPDIARQACERSS